MHLFVILYHCKRGRIVQYHIFIFYFHVPCFLLKQTKRKNINSSKISKSKIPTNLHLFELVFLEITNESLFILLKIKSMQKLHFHKLIIMKRKKSINKIKYFLIFIIFKNIFLKNYFYICFRSARLLKTGIFFKSEN